MNSKYNFENVFELVKDLHVPIYDYDSDDEVEEVVIEKGTVFALEGITTRPNLVNGKIVANTYYEACFVSDVLGEFAHTFKENEFDEYVKVIK